MEGGCHCFPACGCAQQPDSLWIYSASRRSLHFTHEGLHYLYIYSCTGARRCQHLGFYLYLAERTKVCKVDRVPYRLFTRITAEVSSRAIYRTSTGLTRCSKRPFASKAGPGSSREDTRISTRDC